MYNVYVSIDVSNYFYVYSFLRLSRIISHDWFLKNGRNAPDPVYPNYMKIWKYGTRFLNIVDFVAIIPFYVSLFVQSGSSASIVRILRLARLLRIFRMKKLKASLNLLTETLKQSVAALGILVFFASLVVVLFASIVYNLELGEFTVNDDYPKGEYLRWNSYRTDKEISPFKSILISCYWAVVTSTTVGYGDLAPTSPLGRSVAVLLMYIGILIIALPVGVIGSSFTNEYAKLHANDSPDEKAAEIKEMIARLEDDDDEGSAIEFVASTSPLSITLNDTPDEEILSQVKELAAEVQNMSQRINLLMATLEKKNQK